MIFTDTVSLPHMVKEVYSSRVFRYGLCYVIVKSKLYMHERSLKRHLMKQILDWLIGGILCIVVTLCRC